MKLVLGLGTYSWPYEKITEADPAVRGKDQAGNRIPTPCATLTQSRLPMWAGTGQHPALIEKLNTTVNAYESRHFICWLPEKDLLLVIELYSSQPSLLQQLHNGQPHCTREPSQHAQPGIGSFMEKLPRCLP